MEIWVEERVLALVRHLLLVLDLSMCSAATLWQTLRTARMESWCQEWDLLSKRAGKASGVCTVRG